MKRIHIWKIVVLLGFLIFMTALIRNDEIHMVMGGVMFFGSAILDRLEDLEKKDRIK